MTSARIARLRVDQEIDRFLEQTDRERLLLYRMHLQATVRSASPLIMDLAGHFGIDVAGRLDAVRPPSQWPWRARKWSLAASLAHGSLAPYNYVGPRRRTVHGMLRRRAAEPGFIHFADGDDLLAFHFDGLSLSMEACIGASDVRVAKGMAALTLPAGIPDTLAAAMVGRQVDALVESPALAGRGYVVRRVREARAGAGPTLVFATGRTRFAMPWPELLGAGAAGTSADRGGRDRHAGVGLAARATVAGSRPSPGPGVAP